MALRINNNINAFDAYRNLSAVQNDMSTSMQRLSSGLRINRAADDAAGLAISEKMRSQITGLKMASRNAADGQNLVQTAEGALNETTGMLQRIRELAVQASNTGANGGNAGQGVSAIQGEVDQLVAQIDQIGGTTQFNGTTLLNTTSTLTFQVGANRSETITFALSSMTSLSLGGATALSTLTSGGTNALTASYGNITNALTVLDASLTGVSNFRATLGAIQNRFERVINNLNTTVENVMASESQIRDTDMAQEMVSYTRAQILSQAGQSMLAQANSAPQSVLQLLRG